MGRNIERRRRQGNEVFVRDSTWKMVGYRREMMEEDGGDASIP